MSLGVPPPDALHEKQAPHSLCGACSLEVPATLIEPECEIANKSLLGRVTQSIPEFLSIAHAIDNDFHLRPSSLTSG
jgi:hypothetical protein